MARRVAPRSGLVALLALAAALSACGRSKERELFDERRAACGVLLGKTILEARQLLGQLEVPRGCSASLARAPGDTCGGGVEGPYAEPVCQLEFAWVTSDAGICSPRSCVYGCFPRVDQAQGEALGSQAPICAVEFFAPQ